MFESFVTAFLRTVESFPDNRALDDGNQSFTYKELDELSSGLAEKLVLSGVERGYVIAVDCGRSCAHVISLLAIWKVNAVFLPLDTSQAEERQKYVLSDAEVDFIITDKTNDPGLKTVEFEYIRRPFFNPVNISPDDSSYIIYTSGSTGSPKGVAVSHSGLVIMLEDQVREFELGPESKSLFCLSIYFDASLSDIGTALLSGAELIFAHPCQMNPASLISIIHARKITYIDIPPSILRLINPEDKPQSLKTIVIGGEVCKKETVILWSETVKLINVYGPTEATICTSMCVCSPDWEEPVLGSPMSGVIYKISEDNELLINSQGLAEKYLNLPELTSSKFIMADGKRFYRSGDKVIYKNGDYHFLGRLDRQVKLNGQLVEPEEVEKAVANLEGVKEVAVFKLIAGQRQVLTAVYAGTAEKADIIESLKSRLSSWLIPKRIERVDCLPRNHANKIDFKKLQEQMKCAGGGEDLLSKTINKYFGYEISGTADLFEEGLDSFGVMELSLTGSRKGLNLTPSLISEQRTVNNIRKSLAGNDNNSSVLRNDALRELADTVLTDSVPGRGRVLLTGATGFLGGEILRQLQTLGRSVICLVRRKGGIDSETICGDVSKKYFGLSEIEWSQLSGEVDEVIHCAAEVNNIKSYQDLYSVNVRGTAEILKFCNTGRAKYLHYCSTLSVFVSTDRNNGLLREKDRLENISFVYGGYARSKFTAEVLLLKAKLKYPWINIVRFGLITGENRRSRDESLMMLIRAIFRSGIMPCELDSSFSFDVTPVNMAANFFCDVFQAKSGGVYHIANENSVSLKSLIDLISEKKSLKPVSFEDWQNAMKQDRTSEGTAVYLSLCRLWGKGFYDKFRAMDILQGTDVEFECSTLRELGNQIKADDNYLRRLIDFALEGK